MKRLLAALALLALVAAAHCKADPRRVQAREALDRTLEWLRAHPPEADAPLAVHGMDIWTWNLVSRLHPDRSARDAAAGRTRDGLRRLTPPQAPDWVDLSWWVVVLRCAGSQGLDTQPFAAALAAADLEELLARSAPTTAWWSSHLLRHAGLPVASSAGPPAIAAAAARGAAYRPSVRDAYAFYHELVSASDFGRRPLSVFTPEQLDFVRETHPRLMALVLEQGDTDAVAELIVAGAALGQQDALHVGAAVAWLLERQLDDGTFRGKQTARGTSDTRHGVLVGTWALLVYLSEA